MRSEQSCTSKKMLFCLVLVFLVLMSVSVTHAENYNFVTEWGSYGNSTGQFYCPTGIAIGPSGNVCVADTYNNRIQVFYANGTSITEWGSYGDGNGQFNCPIGVAVDSSGDVYVADTYNHRIQKFNISGEFITKWGSYGSGIGQFCYPYSLAVDSSGNVYVADTYNHRIQKFSSLKITPEITWNNPADITYGTPLSGTQLNASALIPGAFVYTPQAGTILEAGTHTLHVDFTPRDAVNYTTASKNVTINVLENKTKIFNVVGTSYECNSWSDEQYPLINLSGANYVTLLPNGKSLWESEVNKLSKLVLDSGEEYELKTGEVIDLGEGYTIEAKQIDVNGSKVWLEFRNNGEYIDDANVSASTGGGENNTWEVKLDDVQDENDIVVLRVHVSQLLQGEVDSIARLDGIWLIDYKNSMTLEVGDQIGNLTLTDIIYGTDASNLGALVFESL